MPPFLLLLLFLATESLGSTLCPQQCTATADGSAWPCRYFDNQCKIPVVRNTSKTDLQDVNLVVMSPYSGSLGDVMTMAEPLLAAAAQEIESSNFLPGYRVNVYLADSRCTKQDATEATVRAFSTGPTKHALLGDSCSSACESINDALGYYNVLHVSPNCISTGLSDNTRYPYFTRMAPSFRFNVITAWDVMKLLGWKRVGVIYGRRSITTLAKDIFLELVDRDLAENSYDWTLLLTRQVTTIADAQGALQEIRQRDARIIFHAGYEDMGAMLLCQSYLQNMLSPDYIWIMAAGWWNQNFLKVRSGTETCPCTVEQMHSAGYGFLAIDRGPMLNNDDLHGLSRRPLKDIYQKYSRACQGFANGTGTCNYQWSGYFYDGLWHLAALFRTYLIDENLPYSSLGTEFSRQRLYEISLMQDYMGLTGRVRQFNEVEPVTIPPSHGDRDGVNLVRQLTGMPPNEFSTLGYWTGFGVEWQSDIRWSPDNISLRVPCASGTCDMPAGWVPPDRSSQCEAGFVWDNVRGCNPCRPGENAEAGASACSICVEGSFTNATGQSECTRCPKGRASKVLRAERCVLCEAGRFAASEGQTSCDKCGIGFYGAAEGMQACDACTPGRTTLYISSENVSSCVCNEGFRLEGSQCTTCMEGLICKGMQPIAVEPGYNAGNDLSVFRCHGDVLRCPGGSPGDTCAPGRTGVSCAECLEGYIPAEGGSCEPCRGSDALPFAMVMMLVMAAMILVYVIVDRQDQLKQSHALLFAAMTASLAVTLVQQLGIVGMFSVTWEEPLQTLLTTLRVFSFDIEVLRFGCVVSTTPLMRYSSKIVITALCLVFFVILHVANVIVRHGGDFAGQMHTLICIIGTLMMAFYISLVSTIVAPLQCVPHPNGKTGVLEYQAVVCFESDDHVGMLVLGFTAMLVPLTYLAWCLMAIRSFPEKMNKLDAIFLRRYAFLFVRYRPETYWYALAHIFRSLALSLAVIIPDIVGQILVVEAILFAHLLLTALAKPWRLNHINIFDLLLTVGVLMMVSFSAFFVDSQGSKQTVAWFASTIVVLVLASVPPMLARGLLLHMYQKIRKPFSHFLCHHKAGAGSFARLLKMGLLACKTVKKDVFIDCDDLKDLDLIFDYVRCQSDMLVVCCSMELFSRPWCLGEMVVAMRNSLKAVKVILNDFQEFDDDFIADYMNFVPDVVCLSERGVGLVDVQAALRWTRNLPCLYMPAMLKAKCMEDLAQKLSRSSEIPPSGLRIDRASATWPLGAESKVCLLADLSVPEAVAAAMVLGRLLGSLMAHDIEMLPFILPEEHVLPESVKVLIIMCSSGVFQNSSVLSTLKAAAQRQTKYIPMITDDSFRFPSSEALAQQQKIMQLDGTPASEARALLQLIRLVFHAVAIVFQPSLYSSSAKTLQTKVEEVQDRLLEKKAKLPTLVWQPVEEQPEKLEFVAKEPVELQVEDQAEGLTTPEDHVLSAQTESDHEFSV